VIDKDLSTALLAREIRADVLVITTGVEKVCITSASRTSRRWIR
jgi:carbamate kinase